METYNSMSEKFGFRRVGSSELPELKSVTSREVLRKLGIPLIKLPRVIREARLRFQDRIQSLHPIEGIAATLLQLKGLGFQLGVLTSNSKENVTRFLDVHQLNFFDIIYSDASIFGKGKVIRTVLKKQKLRSAQVLYVGDETRDIDAARSAGVRIISVSWGFNTREILHAQKPDFLIDQPSQLSDVCIQLMPTHRMIMPQK